MRRSTCVVTFLIGFGIGSFPTDWLMNWAVILAWGVSVVSEIVHPNEELNKKLEKFFFGDL